MKTKEFAGMHVEHDEDGIYLTPEQARELDAKLAIAVQKKEQSTAEYISATKVKTVAAQEEIKRLSIKAAKLEKQPAAIGGGAVTKGDGFLGAPDKPVDREAQRIYETTQANKDSYVDHQQKYGRQATKTLKRLRK